MAFLPLDVVKPDLGAIFIAEFELLRVIASRGAATFWLDYPMTLSVLGPFALMKLAGRRNEFEFQLEAVVVAADRGRALGLHAMAQQRAIRLVVEIELLEVRCDPRATTSRIAQCIRVSIRR